MLALQCLEQIVPKTFTVILLKNCNKMARERSMELDNRFIYDCDKQFDRCFQHPRNAYYILTSVVRVQPYQLHPKPLRGDEEAVYRDMEEITDVKPSQKK